jgi:hypothetical protein
MAYNPDVFISVKGEDSSLKSDLNPESFAIGREFAKELEKEITIKMGKLVTPFLYFTGNKEAGFTEAIMDTISQSSFFILILGKKEYWKGSDEINASSQAKGQFWLEHEWDSYKNTLKPGKNRPDSYFVVYNNNKDDNGFTDLTFLGEKLTENNNYGLNFNNSKEKESAINHCIQILTKFYKSNADKVRNIEASYEKFLEEGTLKKVNTNAVLKRGSLKISEELIPITNITVFKELLTAAHLDNNENEIESNIDQKAFSNAVKEISLNVLKNYRNKLKSLVSLFFSFNKSDFEFTYSKPTPITIELASIINLNLKISDSPENKENYREIFNKKSFKAVLDYYLVKNFNRLYTFSYLLDIYSFLVAKIQNLEEQEMKSRTFELLFIGPKYFFLKQKIITKSLQIIKSNNLSGCDSSPEDKKKGIQEYSLQLKSFFNEKKIKKLKLNNFVTVIENKELSLFGDNSVKITITKLRFKFKCELSIV